MKTAQDVNSLGYHRLQELANLNRLNLTEILTNVAKQDPNGQITEEAMNAFADTLDMQGDQMSQRAMETEDAADAVQDLVDIENNADAMPLTPAIAKRKVFNLKKNSQFNMGYDESMPNAADDAFRNEQSEMQSEPYEEQAPQEPDSIASTLSALDSYQSPVEFVETFRHRVNPVSMDDFEKLVSVYFEDMKGRPEVPQIDKEKAAEQIYDAMTNDEGMVEVPAQWEDSSQAIAMANDIIKESEAQIKKLAAVYARQKQSSKSFNLKKQAQHHTDQSVIMWGPDEKRIDPFYRQPVSDWHILERNKGFGQDIDGVWNIDWEAVWRGTVMDKYSRPYRDSKTGEWVGGYIQKRFEVDKNIPEQNNMQLLPGQTRKPRLPEYGSTESRLQAMRAKNDRGYGPITNTDKPYDWNAEGDKEYAKIASSFNLSKQAKKKV